MAVHDGNEIIPYICLELIYYIQREREIEREREHMEQVVLLPIVSDVHICSAAVYKA